MRFSILFLAGLLMTASPPILAAAADCTHAAVEGNPAGGRGTSTCSEAPDAGHGTGSVADPTTGMSRASAVTAGWLADLEQSRQAMQVKYANLEWATMEREVKLPELFRETQVRIESATSDAEARAALERLARRIGDGHVGFRWPDPHPSAGASEVTGTGCRALGYDAAMQGAPVAALIPGYEVLTSGTAGVFPTGILRAAGHKLGVLKIGLFGPQGYPQVCAEVLSSLNLPVDATCDDTCADRIQQWVSDRLTVELADAITHLRRAGAEILLIDIAGNGGGTEWAEAAARMVTRVRLQSERVGFVRGEHWAKEFSDLEADLRAYAKDADGADRAELLRLAGQASSHRREAETPCESGPLWQGQPATCSWLGEGFYGSGLLASADAASLRGKPWAELLFKPMRYPYREGVWAGSVIVLVDGGTASAAEQFTAILQDNHAAWVIGAPTAGAGCGHTNGGTPTTLAYSGAVLELPDCVRFRRDGTNEVMGITPDTLVGFHENDGASRRALRVAATLASGVRHVLASERGHRRAD